MGIASLQNLFPALEDMEEMVHPLFTRMAWSLAYNSAGGEATAKGDLSFLMMYAASGQLEDLMHLVVGGVFAPLIGPCLLLQQPWISFMI